jgi:preprotein translocase subunit SecF
MEVKWMKKYFKWILLFIILIIIFKFSINTHSINKGISKSLGIKIPENIRVEYEDTHGGFHGDGDLVAKVKFEEEKSEKILIQIKNNPNWKPLPLTKNTEIALYQFYGLAEKVNMPKIDKGYWFFVDRFGGEIMDSDDAKLLSRNSANFTVGIYDTENNILYYYELDT